MNEKGKDIDSNENGKKEVLEIGIVIGYLHLIGEGLVRENEGGGAGLVHLEGTLVTICLL